MYSCAHTYIMNTQACVWRHTGATHARHTNTTQKKDNALSIGAYVGRCSEAIYLLRNSAMDDSIGGSYGVTGLRVQ